MEHEYNPYAAPQADTPLLATVEESDKPAIWRDGRFVVIPHGAQVPLRCWRCNSAQIEGQWKCQLSWFPPVYLLLLLLGVLPLLLVVFFVQRRATFALSLCPDHARRRRRNLFISVAIGFAGLVSMFYGAFSIPGEAGQFLGIGLLAIFAALIYGGIMVNLVSPRLVDKHIARVTGAGRAFRNSLPDAMGRTGDVDDQPNVPALATVRILASEPPDSGK
jgi:hypothetical protein